MNQNMSSNDGAFARRVMRTRKIAAKIRTSCQTIGIPSTLAKLLRHSFRRLFFNTATVDEKLARIGSIEHRFTEIYRRNHWGNFESVSGNGSTLEATANIRRELPALLEKLSIKSIFDAPCGDFNWMEDALRGSDVRYVGGDIVQPLIEQLNARFQDSSRSFVHLDITQDAYPNADLMICRDCLFHLSYNDTKRALQRFVDSKIPYLLTSTYVNNGKFRNHDIATGAFRLIDLFSAPYYFPKNVLCRIDDSVLHETAREMCLWSNDQIACALENFGAENDAREVPRRNS